MSGVEVAAGFVLAVLPLLISTIEHYDDVLSKFKRYKRVASEFRRFNDELVSEQVIFHPEALLLLASVTTYDIAASMLDDPEHPSWKDFELDVKLSQSLGSSCSSCKRVVAIIEEDLKKIKEQFRMFDDIANESSTLVCFQLTTNNK